MKFVTETDVQSETGVTLTVDEASGLISEASFSVFNLIQPNAVDEANPDEWIKAATAHMVAHLKKYGSVLQVGSFSLGGLSISGSNAASSIPAIPDVVLHILNAGGYLYRGLS